ncbi:MAG: phage adaptor protein [Candidatus Thorarchaeota archaeon]|jgi:hypothetical protein
MITNTKILDTFERFTRNISTINRDFGQDLTNQARRRKAAGYDWPFLEKTLRIDSVASQQTYLLPHDIYKVRSVAYQTGDSVRRLIEIKDRQTFEELITPQQEGLPTKFYIENRTLYLHPTPASDTEEIIVNYKKKIIDFSYEDTTAGTIDVVNDSAIINGTATSWDQTLVGQYIQLPNGCWAEVVSVAGANVLNIDLPYEGVTSTGNSYVIGQTEVFPDGFEYLSVYEAVADYYHSVDGKLDTSNLWFQKAEALEERMRDELGNKTTDVAVNEMDNIYSGQYRNGFLPMDII